MYRVLLRVQRVCIRVKEAVHIQIMIKKNCKHFKHSAMCILVNGVASINTNSQFFILKRDPSFEIQVLLLVNQSKKLGGTAQVSLKSYRANERTKLNLPLYKSIDLTATISVDLLYFQTDMPGDAELFSLSQHQSLLNEQQRQKIKEENALLQEQNQRLNSKMKQLEQENDMLQEKFQQIENQFEMNESLFSKRMILKQQEKEKSKLVLEKEKWRIAEIIDVISKSNNAILINHVGEIIDAESRKSLETDRNISQ